MTTVTTPIDPPDKDTPAAVDTAPIDEAPARMTHGEVLQALSGLLVGMFVSILASTVVSNALPDRTTVSIHVYGANIGAVRRSVFDAETGAEKVFVSGYTSSRLPNLWDRSAQVRAALS